jgi:hypothetical protein
MYGSIKIEMKWSYLMKLSRFDSRKYFSGKEIACLIRGQDPTEFESSNRFEYEITLVNSASDDGVAHVNYAKSIGDPANYIGTALFSNQLLVFFKRKNINVKLADSDQQSHQNFELQSFKIDFMKWQLSADSHFNNLTFDRNEIARWIDSCNIDSEYYFGCAVKVISEIDKPLGTRERNTLLIIIAALCEEAKLNYKTAAKTAVLIRSMTDQVDARIGESTIEGHLKKIPDALEARMKIGVL